jgi:hypothetical protein
MELSTTWAQGGLRRWSSFLALCLLILTLGCLEETPKVPIDEVPLPERGYYMGLLPTTSQDGSLDEAYALAAETCEFVPVWGRPSPYFDLAEDLKGYWGKTFVTGLVRGNGMFPLVHMSFFEKDGEELVIKAPAGMEGASLMDPAWRESYISAVQEVARAARPLHMSIGNEVNRWYEAHGDGPDDPNGFQHFVSLYHEAYDAVKAINPATKVFCVFAREIVNQNREADLSVLELFDDGRLDLLAFTSYAFSVQGVSASGEIDDDYFSRAFSNLTKRPMAFTELGWLVHPAFGGEEGQADFLRDVATRLTAGQEIQLEFLGWNWLHDLEGGDSSGLIYRNGTTKAAYQVWRELSAGGG